MADKKEFYTMGEAADELKITRQAIWHAITRGRLAAFRHEHIVLITPENLELYRGTRKKGGRPFKDKQKALAELRKVEKQAVRNRGRGAVLAKLKSA